MLSPNPMMNEFT